MYDSEENKHREYPNESEENELCWELYFNKALTQINENTTSIYENDEHY